MGNEDKSSGKAAESDADGNAELPASSSRPPKKGGGTSVNAFSISLLLSAKETSAVS